MRQSGLAWRRKGTCEQAIAEPWSSSARPASSLISVCLGLWCDLQCIHSNSEYQQKEEENVMEKKKEEKEKEKDKVNKNENENEDEDESQC